MGRRSALLQTELHRPGQHQEPDWKHRDTATCSGREFICHRLDRSVQRRLEVVRRVYLLLQILEEWPSTWTPWLWLCLHISELFSRKMVYLLKSLFTAVVFLPLFFFQIFYLPQWWVRLGSCQCGLNGSVVYTRWWAGLYENNGFLSSIKEQWYMVGDLAEWQYALYFILDHTTEMGVSLQHESLQGVCRRSHVVNKSAHQMDGIRLN